MTQINAGTSNKRPRRLFKKKSNFEPAFIRGRRLIGVRRLIEKSQVRVQVLFVIIQYNLNNILRRVKQVLFTTQNLCSHVLKLLSGNTKLSNIVFQNAKNAAVKSLFFCTETIYICDSFCS